RFKSAAARLDDNQRLTRAHLEAVGFDCQTGEFAEKQEWRRHVSGKVEDERLEPNRSIRPLAQLWRAVSALFSEPDKSRASGWLKVTRRQDGTRVISISGRRQIHPDFAVPTLLIDADLDLTLSKLIWPNLETIADIKVDARHQTIIQAA